MLGLLEVTKLLSNKNALAEKIKSEVPGLIDQLVAVIGAQCGAEEGTPFAVTLFTADTENGTTTMARVHRINGMFEIGEELGTINLRTALAAVPNESITSILPF
jgi:hypothetical protein